MFIWDCVKVNAGIEPVQIIFYQLVVYVFFSMGLIKPHVTNKKLAMIAIVPEMERMLANKPGQMVCNKTPSGKIVAPLTSVRAIKKR